MARNQSPLVGYNTNVRHKGRLYHIQTEDSGVNHPHIITHLFADGGRIIASRKTSYAEHVKVDDLATLVRKLMQEQHKAVFIGLRDCVYDDDEDEAASAQAKAGTPAKTTATATGESGPDTQATAPTEPAADAGPTNRDNRPDTKPNTKPELERRATTEGDSAAKSGTAGALDVAALEAAAAARSAESVASRARAIKPKRGGGRYQQTRPANGRSQVRVKTGSEPAVVGGDFVQDKSLDEVILGYLSDDISEA